jgi:hypothetical protein
MSNFNKGDRIKKVCPRSDKTKHGVILNKYFGPNGSQYYCISWDSGSAEIVHASAADIYLDFDSSFVFEKDKVCNHRWKIYVGFTDQYEYCELCNTKRDLIRG